MTQSTQAHPTAESPLSEWLSWQASLHFSAIDLGLDRVRLVAERMGLLALDFPVITVAGTNGKGSTVAMLTAILKAAHYQVGSYTSPHILHYNERITLNAVPVSDDSLCEAFAAIDMARGDISLTYFEFSTLAAIYTFVQAKIDVGVLEVGLGGRLDATNVWDADVAIISSIGLDHIEWLGDNREQIGAEKAGIARAGKPLICGDLAPPKSIANTAKALGAILWQNGQDFKVTAQADTFSVQAPTINLVTKQRFKQWFDLPKPSLLGDVQLNNAACAVLALTYLMPRLPLVQTEAIRTGLANTVLAGRLQKIQSEPAIWLDVGHNPHAATSLAKWLADNPITGKTYAIFSILKDKDINGILQNLRSYVDEWHIFPLAGDSRAASLIEIEQAFELEGINDVISHASLTTAWSSLQQAEPQDRILVFGSFLLVSSLLKTLGEHSNLETDS